MSLCGTLEFLEWESDFFHLRTAKFHADPGSPPLDVAHLSGFELVQAKIGANDVAALNALQAAGFQFAEGEIDVCIALNGGADSVSAATPASESDIPQVTAAATAAFSLSRFRAPWYQAGDSARFYAVWAEKAVRGTFDHQCLLIKNAAGELQGFVSLREIAPGEARIGLLAVLPAWQSCGIGKQLMAASKHWCVAHGLSYLHVATQTGNVAALNLYLASGGKITRSAYWLYR
ncbi:MAG: dTDP-4-amino-4,6-dideoxy-D-galactose acyltransferase [Ewingella sp.]|nr:dTDP-4-amino-4,6-dideoxy-D-galactose acyltransferase [Ewingella sp.]